MSLSQPLYQPPSHVHVVTVNVVEGDLPQLPEDVEVRESEAEAWFSEDLLSVVPSHAFLDTRWVDRLLSVVAHRFPDAPPQAIEFLRKACMDPGALNALYSLAQYV